MANWSPDIKSFLSWLCQEIKFGDSCRHMLKEMTEMRNDAQGTMKTINFECDLSRGCNEETGV